MLDETSNVQTDPQHRLVALVKRNEELRRAMRVNDRKIQKLLIDGLEQVSR